MLIISKPLFALGQVVATPNALALLQHENKSSLSLVSRHQSGDWGDVCADDALANKEAIQYGYRVMSVYRFATDSLWIITEADRSVTTLLLPEEY